ncbi:MAG: trehalose-phosphatase [Acidobacteriota bacterium]
MVGNILAPHYLPALRCFTGRDRFSGLRFRTGTLAPIVPNPGDAEIPTETRRLLAEVCGLYPCVIVSGRARTDVEGRLEGLPLQAIIGNHGADLGPDFGDRVRLWKVHLQAALEPLQGVWIEDKEQSLAIHYRASRNRTHAQKQILDVAALLEGARLVPAKLALNVVPLRRAEQGRCSPHPARAPGLQRGDFLSVTISPMKMFSPVETRPICSASASVKAAVRRRSIGSAINARSIPCCAN